MFCEKCGAEINDGAVVCVKCGCAVNRANNNPSGEAKNWVVAYLLSWFLGGFGAHRFYLGKSLQLIPQNKWLKNDYFYFVNPEKHAKDTRTGDQIAADIMKRAGLHFEE